VVRSSSSGDAGRAAVRDVVVLTGGDPVDPGLASSLPHDAYVVAADSGLAAADVLRLHVDLVVGDMDSVAPARLAAAEAAGTRVVRHPVAKDDTDLAIAMDAAVDLGATRLTVVGGDGGRLDHLLAGALLLASDAYADVEVVAFTGAATITVVRHAATLHGRPGELVSLLAVHGPARGVVTDGLLYPLAGEQLAPGSTRGVSNELTRPTAHVRLDAGVLLAVQPGELGTHLATQGTTR
jgi:thiamine pyrophosphokinase